MELHTNEILTSPHYCMVDLHTSGDYAFHKVSFPLTKQLRNHSLSAIGGYWLESRVFTVLPILVGSDFRALMVFCQGLVGLSGLDY